MSEQDLTDRIIRDALALQRLAAYEGAQVDELLAQLEAELRALAASGTLSGESKRAIDALIKQADEAIAARYGEAAGKLDTQRLILVVAENTQAALEAVSMGNGARITEETAASLARSVLIEGAPTAAWWAKQSEDAQFRFAQAVRQGVVNGETNERIVARIAGNDGFMAVSRRNARTLVHSSIMSAANRARLAVYKKNFPQGGGVRWLSTLDSHTCIRCAALDGQAWDFDGKPIRGTEIAFQGIPPLHISCFPGDTLVSSRHRVTGVSKRWFDGEMVVIKTASGNELTCTPNHPILTDRGWFAADLIEVGSNVVRHRAIERGELIDGDDEDIPTSIHDVAESFLRSRQVVSVPVVMTAEDFHGDGSDGDVAIIGADSLLRRYVEPLCLEHKREATLIAGSSAGLVALAGQGHTASFVERSNAALGGGMSGGDLLLALFGGHRGPLELFGFGLVPALNTGFAQDAGDDNPLQAKLLGDGILGCPSQVGGANCIPINNSARPNRDAALMQLSQDHAMLDASLSADFGCIQPGDVEFDEVISCGRVKFAGHVYNLETSGGWYIAQGVVVHNCRCVITVLPPSLDQAIGVKGLDELRDQLSRRASSSGPVQTTTFAEFLKRQSPAFVEDVLGVKRAEMFLAGKLTLHDMINHLNTQPLTLDQLAN